jgi:hypothetical protein
MACSIKCKTSENSQEYLIELIYSHGLETQNQFFSSEKTDCPLSYAIIMSLTDFFENTVVQNPVVIYVSDLHAFNLLTNYIKRWHESHWITSNGNPVSYVDILSRYHDVITGNKIKCQVLFNNDNLISNIYKKVSNKNQ